MALHNAFGALALDASVTALGVKLEQLHADLATQATGANQTSNGSKLDTIAAKLPTLESGRTPVALPTATVTALTPPAAITGYATSAKQDTELTKLDTLHSDWVGGIYAVRRDSDSAPVADGQPHVLNTNAIGRLKVSALPASSPNVVGTITTASSVVTADVSRESNVVVDITGTFTGVNVTFETSLDGTNWKVEQGLRSNSAAIESVSGVIATGLAYSWEFSVNGKAQFRVRATAWASGTATVTIGLGSFATEPFVTVPTHGVTLASTTLTSVTPGSAATNLGKAEDAAHATGDVGVAALFVRNDNAATDQTSANADYGFPAIDVKGATFTRERSGTATVTTVAYVATTSTTLIAANAARRGLTIFNNATTAALYLNLAGGTASATTGASVRIAPGAYYEVPVPCTTTAVTGFWETAGAGSANITEMV